MKHENSFQAGLIKKITRQIPDCIILKNDPNYIQGIPDLLVLSNDKWGALEVKRTAGASHQPNQDFYISKMNEMSYAAFVYPENEEEILNELQQALRAQ